MNQPSSSQLSLIKAAIFLLALLPLWRLALDIPQGDFLPGAVNGDFGSDFIELFVDQRLFLFGALSLLYLLDELRHLLEFQIVHYKS